MKISASIRKLTTASYDFTDTVVLYTEGWEDKIFTYIIISARNKGVHIVESRHIRIFKKPRKMMLVIARWLINREMKKLKPQLKAWGVHDPKYPWK
ncbi:hypothetical protein [Paenibacillus hubeiensis]|uniref:hypothetical protein n=1 Tax=Paenibacillus hubeiensis TaxID=3077330 RepID=UPI0031BAB10C